MRCTDCIDTSASNHPLPMAIAPHDSLITALSQPGCRDFMELTKPKVSWVIVYAVSYTGWLKRAPPQNIVIGGAAGGAPPLLGWVAVTHSIDAQALVLFMIIFTWTPPHFWSLAIARCEEYAKVGIPMLPVTHGIPYTRLQILLYTVF